MLKAESNQLGQDVGEVLSLAWNGDLVSCTCRTPTGRQKQSVLALRASVIDARGLQPFASFYSVSLT